MALVLVSVNYNNPDYNITFFTHYIMNLHKAPRDIMW